MMWDYGYYGPGMWLMSFGMIFWIALLVGLTYAVVSWLNHRMRMPSPGTPPYGPSSLEILRQRYARGEIDQATFERMRENLQSSDVRDDQSFAMRR